MAVPRAGVSLGGLIKNVTDVKSGRTAVSPPRGHRTPGVAGGEHLLLTCCFAVCQNLSVEISTTRQTRVPCASHKLHIPIAGKASQFLRQVKVRDNVNHSRVYREIQAEHTSAYCRCPDCHGSDASRLPHVNIYVNGAEISFYYT